MLRYPMPKTGNWDDAEVPDAEDGHLEADKGEHAGAEAPEEGEQVDAGAVAPDAVDGQLGAVAELEEETCLLYTSDAADDM
eukprot:4704662-Alexandrium_andersonii.AAC.1